MGVVIDDRNAPSKTFTVAHLSSGRGRGSGPFSPDITGFDTIGRHGNIGPVGDYGLRHHGGGGDERDSGDEDGLGEGDHCDCCRWLEEDCLVCRTRDLLFARESAGYLFV